MSSYRRYLKMISVVEIIFGVLTLLLALASMGVIALGPELTNETVTSDGITLTIGQSMAMFGALSLVSGVIDVLVGCLGVRGANNPEKIGAYFVLVIIAFVFDVIEVVLAIIGGSDASSLASTIMPAIVSGIFVFIAYKVKSEAK